MSPTQARWSTPVMFVVFALALGIRIHLGDRMVVGESLAMGPDADDWALAVRALVAGDVVGVPGHRFPLVPWLAVSLAESTKLDPLLALRWLSTLASALSCALCFRLAYLLGPPSIALLMGIWMALDPGHIAASLFTTAYAPFAAGFTLLVVALCGVGGGGAAVLAVVGSFVAVSSVNQGILCVLALAPVGLWMMRRGPWVGMVVGLLLGFGWVSWVHPNAHTLIWMLAETKKYLSGNIPEETAAWQGAWWPAFQIWASRSFTLGVWGVGGGVGLLLVGLVAGLRRSGDTFRLTLILAWVVLPLGVLVPDMASGHHLDHLRPSALALMAAGLGYLMPWPRLRLGLVMGCSLLLGTRVLPLGAQRVQVAAVQARSEVEVSKQVGEICGPLALVLVPQGEHMAQVGVLWRSAWALPKGILLWNISEIGVMAGHWPDPPLAQTLGAGGKVFVATTTPRARWRTQHHTYTPLGGEREVVPGLLLCEVDVVANSLLESPDLKP